MGCRLDPDSLEQRPERKTARWRFAGGEAGPRLFHLHELFVVPTVAGRRSWSVSAFCQYGVTGQMKMREDGAGPDGFSWRKAYGLALALFALEVALLYF